MDLREDLLLLLVWVVTIGELSILQCTVNNTTTNKLIDKTANEKKKIKEKQRQRRKRRQKKLLHKRQTRLIFIERACPLLQVNCPIVLSNKLSSKPKKIDHAKKNQFHNNKITPAFRQALNRNQ